MKVLVLTIKFKMTVKNEINAPNVVKTNQMKVISESIIRYTLGKSPENAFDFF